MKKEKFEFNLNMLMCLQNAMPGRLKGFHYYNAGTIFEALMALIRPILSKKLQGRVSCYVIKVTPPDVVIKVFNWVTVSVR